MTKFFLYIFDIIHNRKTLKFLHEFQKLRFLSREKIDEYQFRKLKKLLIHAEINVPYYRELFKEIGFSAKNFYHIEQFKNIPPLTREDLQKHWRELISKSHSTEKLSKGSSSGSTGKPVIYYKNNEAISAGHAANYLGWSFSGWNLNMKGLHIWGNPTTVNNEWKRFSSKLKAYVFRHHKFPAYILTEGDKFNALYYKLKKGQYDFIDGYTNAIYLLAEYMEKNNYQLPYKLKYVFTTAENLHQFQKKLIENLLAPVFDAYGCGEINGIAYQCHYCDAYHVIDPHVYLEFGEVMDEVGSKELYITDLDNYAFPFIRYKNNDLGIPCLKENSCKINFSRIQSISGRQSDVIKLSDGGTLSVPSFFGSMLLKEINGIKQYQIEKVSDDLLNIYLVKTEAFCENDLIKMKLAIHEYLQNRIKYEIIFIDKIKTFPNGKYNLLIDRTK